MKKSTKIFLTWGLGFVVLIFLAEVELRLLDAYSTWEEKNQGDYVSPYKVQDPSWLRLRPPNARYTYTQPEFSYSLSTNSLGIRDRDHRIRPRPETHRLVILGDSLVEGQGASFKHTWPKVMEKGLNSLDRPEKFEVIMGGVAGSDPFYCRQLLEAQLLKFKPNTVIMALNSFDIGDVVTRGGMERFLPDNKIQFKQAPSWEPLFAKSRLVRFILIRLLGYDWMLMSPQKQVQARQNAHGQIVELARELKDLGKKEGFSVVFVFQPHVHELEKGEYDQDFGALAGQIREVGIQVCDILPCMEKALADSGENPKDFFWEKDYHPNSQGYALYAKCVLDCWE